MTMSAFGLLLHVVATPDSIAAQLPFPADTFYRREAVARRLLAYDACGWRSSDALVKRPAAELAGLSPIWVCFQVGPT
jgi:hypothetical protein